MPRINFEEIIIGLIGIMVLVSVATTLFGDPNIGSSTNKDLVDLIVIVVIIAFASKLKRLF